MRRSLFSLSALSGAMLTAGFSSYVHSAGFQIIEHSAVGLGRAYAGEAAIHADPTVLAHNAAGLAFVPASALSFAGHYINPNVDVEGEYTFASPAFSFAPGTPKNSNDDIAESALVPALYGNYRISENWSVGAGAFSDFGLSTNYDRDFSGVLQARKSELLTLNLNLAAAWKPIPQLSVGAGISAVYADVELSSSFSDGTLFLGAPLTNVDFFTADGDDWAFGFNLGLMGKPTDNLTLGFSFRSESEIKVDGDIEFFKRSQIPQVPNQKRGAKADVDLPEMWELSAHWQVQPRWALHGSARWTRWTSFQELRIRIEEPPVNVFGQPTSELVVKESWNNAWRLSLGATVDLTPRWVFRTGIAYDESPVAERFRTLRIPDQDRWWVAAGASYQTASKRWRHDFAVAFLYNESARISDPLDEEIALGQFEGRMKHGNVLILGYQLNVSF